MTFSVLCQGCGKRVPVPDGYTRRKMQCPECGVMCELPPPEERQAEPPAKKAKSRKVAIAPREAHPATAPVAPRAAVAPPTDPTAPIQGDFLDHEADMTADSGEKATLSCSSCGYRIHVPAEAKARFRQCHRCGGRMIEASSTPSVTNAAAFSFADEDDGQPYTVAGPPERVCPDCQRRQPADVEICTGCGFNLDTGEKPAPKVHERIERHWHDGWSLSKRAWFWIAGQAMFIVLNIVVASLLGFSLSGALTAWVFFTAMLSFLMGTYSSIDFTRNDRGKVRLTQTWRVCFIPRPPGRIPVSGCDGVQTGHSYQVGVIDWMILISLLIVGLIPGIIWYFSFMQRDTYHVALTRDHGYAEHILYRGWNQDQAADMAHTIADATGLLYEGF